MRALMVGLALIVSGCGTAVPSVSPSAVGSLVPTTAPTASPRPTATATLPSLTPEPDVSLVVAHVVQAIDELSTGADRVPWITAEGTWVADPTNDFSAADPPLLAYLDALSEALQTVLDGGDVTASVQKIIALRPAIAALAPGVVKSAPPTSGPAKPLVFKGNARQNTKPFALVGADYTVTITGSTDSNVIAYLQSRDGSDYELLFNELPNGKYKYETIIYGIDTAEYYLDMSVGGSWTLTLTALP